jgi:hypothetical protein
MKSYRGFITEVNKHREEKLNYQYKDVTNPKPPVKPLNILKQKKGLKTAQIVPMKTTVLGPDLQSLPHIDTRGPGEKLRSVMRQKNYMDDTGRKPPKIP